MYCICFISCRKGNKLFEHLITKMKISLMKYPVDIILGILWGLILLLLVILDVKGPMRIIFGLPFTFFVPGYILMFALFPYKKSEKGIDNIERFIFSIGMSIAIVSLIGLILNYTPWGIRLEPVILILSLFIFIIGPIAINRWLKRPVEDRFSIFPNFLFPKSDSRFNKPSNIVFAVLIIIPIILAIYTISSPKTGEKFTEFYVLGPNSEIGNYPQNLSLGENTTVTIGIFNHEYRTINYQVGIWLVNQSTYYNETTKENSTLIDHMWFMDEITAQLNHTSVNPEKSTGPQWQYNYSFNLSRQGHFKLVFLLFTASFENYTYNEDYKDRAENLFKSAYREVHLWITVT
jgi:uncharacterized membrane protein